MTSLDRGDTKPQETHLRPADPLLRGWKPVACYRAGAFAKIGPFVMVGLALWARLDYKIGSPLHEEKTRNN